MKKKGTLGAFAAGTVVFCAGSALLVRNLFHKVFKRQEKPAESIRMLYKDANGIQRKKVTIKSGGSNLIGYLYGEKTEKGLVVICHGIGSCGEENISMVEKFLEAGYQVFTFDYTGVSESDGAYSVGFYQAVRDLDRVLDYLRRSDWADSKVFLYGHSWGGYTAAAVLNHDHWIDGVVSVSGFSSPMAIVKEVSRRVMGPVLSFLEIPFAAAYQRVVFGKDYNLSAVEGINSTVTPVLVMHGADDKVIRWDGSGIMGQKDQITNPNVSYYLEERPGKSSHMGIFYTRDSAIYYEEKAEELKMLKELYYGRIPSEVEKKWFSKLNKKQANELDPVFVSKVVDFFDSISAAGK